MKLELQNIEMKNFLSYGNVPQHLDFIEGINLILGKNIESGRSNGAGKSSLIETIPFAWFGKLSRPINKAGIVNWKNGKQCEVKVTFKKGDVTYTVLRAIKPDKFEIYENGTLLPIPSDVRIYQKQFENDVVGMDYNTFMYLFHTNLNTNIPLLKMTTAQKRGFLEKMFVLDTYTNLNTLSNEKIKGLDEKVFKQTVGIEQNEKTIIELENQNSSLRLKLTDITPFETALNIMKLKYEHALTDSVLCVDSNIVEVTIKNIETDIEKIKHKINKLSSDIALLESDNISKQKTINDIKKRKTDHESKLKETKNQLKQEDIDNPTSLIPQLEEQMDFLTNIVNENRKERNDLLVEIATITEKKKGLEITYNTLKDGVCPTCERKITSKTLDKDYLKKINLLQDEIEELRKKEKEKLELLDTSIDESNTKVIEIKVAKEKQRNREALNVTLRVLLDVEIPTYESEEKIISDNTEKIKVFSTDKDSLSVELEKQNKDLNSEKIYLDRIRETKEKIDTVQNEIRTLEDGIKIRRSNKIEIEKIIQENDEKIIRIKQESKTNKSNVTKLKDLVDYLSYLKILCKDENVKQYAISSYISYLTQQTNFYLANSGSTHYLKFNKWLEEEIHGPGVYDATYGNLSGGEARSIDLAIQFAFLDVAKLKTGVFPDVLLLDEILDSSIDGGGLANILKIIKTKQHEDKSKVLIITHRTEISDVDVDNTYVISKKNGFSVIEKQ